MLTLKELTFLVFVIVRLCCQIFALLLRSSIIWYIFDTHSLVLPSLASLVIEQKRVAKYCRPFNYHVFLDRIHFISLILVRIIKDFEIVEFKVPPDQLSIRQVIDNKQLYSLVESRYNEAVCREYSLY